MLVHATVEKIENTVTHLVPRTAAEMDALTMELIELPHTGRELVTMRGPILVSHVECRLRRALEPGEDVVLLDLDGEYHSGFVADLRFELEDTLYVIDRGVRLPPEQASERLDDADGGPEARGLFSTQSVLDMIAEWKRELDGE